MQLPTAARTALLMTAVLVAALLSIVTATARRMRLDSPSTGGGAHHLRRRTIDFRHPKWSKR